MLRDVLLGLLAVVVVLALIVMASYVWRGLPGAKSIRSATHAFSATTTTAPTPKTFALPVAGVYQATGSGSEHINTPPNSAQDSKVMPITVTYQANGCWQWHIDYNTADWHQYNFCPKGSKLLLTSQQNQQSWNFGILSVTNLATFTCTPPSPIVVTSPKVGEHFAMRCVGTNTAVAGSSVDQGVVTIKGVGPMTVGTEKVEAVHMTRTQTITGAQKGTLDESWWFDASTGLPLAASRNYTLVTASPIGNITYTESGSWHLESMTPKT